LIRTPKPKKKVCICQTKWCSELRQDHQLKDNGVFLKSRLIESNCDHLTEVMQSVLLIDDVECAKSKSTAWIWIGHFHEDDINLETYRKNLVEITTKNYSSRAKQYEKHRWNEQPPLPTASKKDVSMSKYYNKKRGGDTLSASRSSSNRKRRAEILLSPLNSKRLSMITKSQDESPLTAINYSTPCGSYSNNEDIVGVVNDIIDVIVNDKKLITNVKKTLLIDTILYEEQRKIVNNVLKKVFNTSSNDSASTNRTTISVSDISKLSKLKLSALYTSLLTLKAEQKHEDNNDLLPIEDVGEMKGYCKANKYLLNLPQDDFIIALEIASDAFERRVKEFQRLWKTLLRQVNDEYVSFSKKFKMYYLVNGLINFASHCCNHHGDCARYLWWVKCVRGDDMYTPSSPYVNNVITNQSTKCQVLVQEIFKTLVIGWVLSKYMNSALWKVITYKITTANESYFHTLAIRIPKWQNTYGHTYIIN
jgi:hypothetical protein